MQCHRIPYWLPAINSFVVSAAFQKTYVAQKAPRSTLPLNLTVSGRSRKAYVERGALFIGAAASRAFGVNETPSWEDFLDFLADRCNPKTRKGMDYYLDAVGVPEYDPVQLVENTQGRMAEDHKWLEII